MIPKLKARIHRFQVMASKRQAMIRRLQARTQGSW